MKKFVLLFMFICTNANAMTGNGLYDSFFSENKDIRDFGKLYILGVLDSERYFTMQEQIVSQQEKREPNLFAYVCVPKNVEISQVTDIVKNYLMFHPEDRHINGMALVHYALLEKWRCEEPQKTNEK